jgi:hypothetical protein
VGRGSRGQKGVDSECVLHGEFEASEFCSMDCVFVSFFLKRRNANQGYSASLNSKKSKSVTGQCYDVQKGVAASEYEEASKQFK